jgi:hypothetical protein
MRRSFRLASRRFLTYPHWFLVVAGTGLQDFTGLKAILVVHGLAFANVKAHVQPLSAVLAGELQFLEYGPGSECEVAVFGVMEEIHAGKSVGGDIDKSERDEFAVEAILEFASEAEVPVNEGFRVFAAFNLPHWPLATLMHVGMIQVVKLKMFRRDTGGLDVELNIEGFGGAREHATLAAGGLKFGDADTQTLAGAAALAGRAKECSAKPPPAAIQQSLVTSFRETGRETVDDVSGISWYIGAVVRGPGNFQFP